MIPLFLVYSCAEDTSAPSDASTTVSSYYRTASIAENALNPYDSLGTVYYELYDAYYSSGSVPGTFGATLDSLTVYARASSNFVKLAGSSSYSFGMESEIEDLLACTSNCVATVVSNAFETSSAISLFDSFLADYDSACSSYEDYLDVHLVVTDYEAEVLADTVLSSGDKRKFLIATSIARFTAYAKKKKPKKNTDPEWALLISNLTASLEGADSSDADAVFGALLTGIMENK